MHIRYPAVASQFYPGNAHMLRQAVLEYLGKASDSPKIPGTLKAIVAPHAGYIYSGPTAGYAYKMIKGLDQEKKWKILLLGPSHYYPFAGAAAPAEEGWQTPLGFVPVKDIREELVSSDIIIDMPEANSEEHSLEVQVPFLQVCLKDFVLYPLVLGSLRPDHLADELLEFVANDDVIVVASSDLSHYLSDEKAREVDHATSEAICSVNIEKMAEIGDACGRTGILTVMAIAEKLSWKCKMLDYSNSGDSAGDYSRVVGYGAYAFYK